MARWRGTARQALIEFTVIVTGVLVALGVDAWREGEDNREAERAYVLRLVEDIRADTLELIGAFRTGSVKQERLRRLMDLDERTLNDSSALPSIAEDLERSQSWGWEYPAARRVTFDELQSVGGLNLIRDVEVREAISHYYWWHEDTEDRVESRRSDLPALTYSLFLYRSDDEVGLSSLDALRAAVRSGRLHEAAVGELNFTRYQLDVTEGLMNRARILLERLHEYGGG